MARKTKKDALESAGLIEPTGTSEKTELVATIDSSLVDKQIAELEGQFNKLAEQLNQLEREFNEKKAWALTTLEQLRGGVLALRGLKEGQTGTGVSAE